MEKKDTNEEDKEQVKQENVFFFYFSTVADSRKTMSH
jgi:hypothetical protein